MIIDDQWLSRCENLFAHWVRRDTTERFYLFLGKSSISYDVNLARKRIFESEVNPLSFRYHDGIIRRDLKKLF
jgi:hypothetical protein